MFFFFFNNLYYIPEIRQAFRNICLNKLLTDGYFDMNVYISGRLKKDYFYNILSSLGSKYAALYQGSYPKAENAMDLWHKKIPDFYNDDNWEKEVALSDEESSAIVNWVYRCFENIEERENFTKNLINNLDDFNSIKHTIAFARGVVYNKATIELHFLSSVSSVNTFLSQLKNKEPLFFRGHSNVNFSLQPSIMRSPKIAQNENHLFHDLIISCPEDFEKCHTHFEKLVKMQHYGLPTRLLDITRNPLVALYFACESHPESYGELILISASRDEIKYPQSDTVSVLSSLAAFPYAKQTEFLSLALNSSISTALFNQKISRLIHEIQLEKPAFQAEVQQQDITSNFIVYALKSNSRIVKQDGAFILCGLPEKTHSLEKFRYREHGKKVIVLLEKKKQILKQLDTFSINRASLFPEIECVAEYLKDKYNR